MNNSKMCAEGPIGKISVLQELDKRISEVHGELINARARLVDIKTKCFGEEPAAPGKPDAPQPLCGLIGSVKGGVFQLAILAEEINRIISDIEAL